MFKKILIVLVLAIAGLAAYVAMQPAEFRVSRSATMNAPAADIFAQINDFHKWEAWSPWAKVDPKAVNTFAGPESGKDASFAWAGNKEVGKGKMTIVESKPNEFVKIKLEFFEPYAAVCVTDFTLKSEGEKTAVTWSMSGENTFFSKAVHLVMNMDKMVGEKYEEGLASMKKIVEAK